MKEKAARQFAELLGIIEKLRSPEGCPWDRKQTHTTLVPYLIEEAHEVASAIEESKLEELPGELGDVLLQVVLHSQIGKENLDKKHSNGFNICDVIEHLIDKMKYRHPHVFGSITVANADEVINNWQELKLEETSKDVGLLDSVSKTLPQLSCAFKLQQKAAQVGFDWDNIDDVIDKVDEEIDELKEEIFHGSDQSRIENELGDLIFAIVNVARKLKIDPEDALRKANGKFKRRFSGVEKRSGGSEKMRQMSLEELDLLWDDVKKTEKE